MLERRQMEMVWMVEHIGIVVFKMMWNDSREGLMFEGSLIK